MADFDPYLKWLGIRSKGRAPNYYRLLGLDLFESDSDIIANAAERQIAHVKTFQQGPEGDYAQDILNRLANARLTLLKPESKAAYDQKLKAKIKAMRAARAQPATDASQRPPQQRPATPSIPVNRPALPGTVSTASIEQRPEKKKRSPFVSLILALLMWGSSAVAALVAGYFIVNSSWFPSNQPDLEVAELDGDAKPFGISVVGEDPKPLPSIDEVLGEEAANKKRPGKSMAGGKGFARDDFALKDNRNPKSKQPNRKPQRNPAKKPKINPFGTSAPPVNPATKELAFFAPEKVEPIIRSAVPDRTIVASLTQQLKDLYKSGYSKEAMPNDKKKLAESLLKDGLATQEPAMQFAMLDQSIEVSSSIGDGTTAVEALEALDLRFEIDFWERADEVVGEAKRKVKVMPQYEATAVGIDRLTSRSISESRFSEASGIAAVGSLLSRKFKDLKRFQRFESLTKDLKGVRVITKKSDAAMKKLAMDPNDPVANLDQGSYLYLVKDDLRGAIEHWSKSSSEDYQMIAGLEAEANRSDGSQLLELALAWKKLGDRLKTASDIKFSFRAKELCEKCAPMLDGLKKLQAENAVLELKEALKGKTAINIAALGSTEVASTGSPFLDAVYKHDWSIDFSNSTTPDLQKATFLPSGMAAMVTTKGEAYQVMFEVEADGVYWTQATTSGNPIRVGIRPYRNDNFLKLRCYSQTSPTSSPVSAGYATAKP